MSVPVTLHYKGVRMEPTIIQRENERDPLTVEGKRTDGGSKCTLLAVREVGDSWALYPHGAAQLGVRVAKAEAYKVAQAILANGVQGGRTCGRGET
jgi:hypothetical protein